MNDIIIYFKILKKHLHHLNAIFSLFIKRNIFIKFSKVFLEYLTVQLLRQKISLLRLTTDKEKLKIIVCLTFLCTLKKLETYLELMRWLCQFVLHYIAVIKSLQKRKTILLKSMPKTENSCKSYVLRISLMKSNSVKIVSFKMLQSLLFKFSYLIHFNLTKHLYINLNAFKFFDFDVMIYHIKKEVHINIKKDDSSIVKIFLSKLFIQLIMFLSRLLKLTKTHYWLTELKLVSMIWVVWKVRHLIELLNLLTIIYTDHEVNVKIVKQISLLMMLTEKQNLCLMHISEYLQCFNLNVCHKSEKQHIVLNVLSQLALTMLPETDMKENKLDTLFVVNALFVETYIKMLNKFQKCLIQDYDEDLTWHHTIDILNKNKNNSNENIINLSFEWDSNSIIWHQSLFTSDHIFEPQQLIILHSLHKNIFHIIYIQNDYSDF